MKNKKKDKYFFNPESLQFESVSQSFWHTVRRIFSLIVTSFLIAALYYAGYAMFFYTPMELSKKQENIFLRVELSKLNARYSRLEKVVDDIKLRDTLIYRTLFEANPLDINEIGSKNILNNYEMLEKANNNELILGTKRKLVAVQKLLKTEELKMDSISRLLESRKDALNMTPAILPIKNFDISSAGASVGHKINPFFKTLKMHTGMDFAVPVGTEVVATADGVVTEVWYSLYGSGNRIVIDHNKDYETRYLYLNEINVKKGTKVKRGQVIGKVGNLGMTVPHLHYEVRRGGKIADPLNFFVLGLNPQQIEQIMLISLNNGQSLD